MNTEEPTFKDQMASYIGIGDAEPVEAEPAMPVAPGERVAWAGTLTATWPLLMAVIGLVGAVVAIFLSPPLIPVALIAGLAGSVFARIRVLADARGVRVRFGWLPWPTKFVDIADIAHAGVINVRPTEWGGWGYRIARPAKGFSRSAVVLRGGEGLHLTLRNGREFAVTIDDAAEAASVVNAYAGTP